MKRAFCLLLCSIVMLFFLDGGRFSEARGWFTPGPYGTYQVNYSQSCLDWGVPDPDSSGDTTNRTLFNHVRGESTYYGNGNGLFVGEWVAVDLLNARVTTFVAVCDIEYEVLDRINFTQDFTECRFNKKPDPPPFDPPSFGVRTGIKFTGVITRNGKLLLLSDTDNNVASTTLAGVINFTSSCGRTGTAVRTSRGVHYWDD